MIFTINIKVKILLEFIPEYNWKELKVFFIRHSPRNTYPRQTSFPPVPEILSLPIF